MKVIENPFYNKDGKFIGINVLKGKLSPIDPFINP
jgi:hypothetical protein